MDYRLFDTINDNFIKHLNAEGNERILYSGKFGVGKSTFLRHFFKDNEKYNCIHLYPVNYSILSNEDIFTYLKFDILFDLLTDKGIELESAETYGYDVALPYFLKNNWFRFLSLIPHLFDKVGGVVPGKGIADVMKGCEELYKQYQAFAYRTDGDLDEFDRFQKAIMIKEGGLYESNALNNIIRTELSEIKSSKSKENILIIDDLDRLDPDHIFRLLNVFSAHFDERHRAEGETSRNKYGFDKIILVCDNENIRNIFKARYGMDTDYNGYIDKFYSKEIFEHRVSDLIDIFSRQFFKNLKTSYTEYDSSISEYFPYFQSLVKVFLQQNLMNLRTFFKYSGVGIDLSHKNTMLDSINRITRHSFDTILILDSLSIIFGHKDNLKLVLEKIKENQVNDPFKHNDGLRASVIGELIYLNGDIKGKWESLNNRESEATFQLNSELYQIKKTIYKYDIVGFSLNPQIAKSLDLNYLTLFKKYR